MYRVTNYGAPKLSDYSFTSSKMNKTNSQYVPDIEQNIVEINKTESDSKTTQPEEISQTRKPKRGINFDKLDKEKTYVGMQYARRHKLAKQIVRFTKKYCPDSDVPAHLFALAFKDGDWQVYESHIMTNEELGLVPGTHRLKAKDWMGLGKNAIAETDIFEAKLDVDALEENANEPYGKGDMVKQFFASIFNFNGKQSDSKGLLCSEYIATGMQDICDYYDLPTWALTPAHFKDYLVKQGAKQVNE